MKTTAGYRKLLMDCLMANQAAFCTCIWVIVWKYIRSCPPPQHIFYVLFWKLNQKHYGTLNVVKSHVPMNSVHVWFMYLFEKK